MTGRVKVKVLIVSGVTSVAILLAVAVALYSLFLIFIGQPWTVVQEASVPGVRVESAPESLQLSPVPHALAGLVAAAMLLGGFIGQKLAAAWAGLVILFAFATLFLFGVGGVLLPIAGLLLILLTTITVVQRNRLNLPENVRGGISGGNQERV